MPRIFHALAIVVLLASAAYVYKIKYESIAFARDISKLEKQIAQEKGLIARRKAEWQHLNSPERVQALADTYAGMHPMSVDQIVRWQDIPDRQAPVDAIADKLLSLGLADATSTPSPVRSADARTPTVKRP